MEKSRKCRFAGEIPLSSRVRALWGSHPLVCLFFWLRGEKYCHNGGMVFAHEHGHRLLALGSNALWGQQWTRLPPVQMPQVLPQRGHGLRLHITRRLPRSPTSGARDREVSMNSIMAPIPAPTKRLICREELPRVHDSRPLGAAMRSFARHRDRFRPLSGRPVPKAAS
jgi:hypothetical protein